MFAVNLHGQISLQNDTIRIESVEIKGKAYMDAYAGSKVTRFDSSVISDYKHMTVAELLSETSGIYIKSYGSGGLATASFRGTGAGHTQLAWNSININNPMVGQSDLSLVPAGFFDDINILYGGGSMNVTSGGSGGMIDLVTKPVWDDHDVFYLNTGIGSFGRYSGMVKIKTGNYGFQSVTKAFLKNAENDFRYLNSVSGAVPYWETRENSQVHQKGLIQELYFKNSSGTYSARLWYQSALRNLAVPVITRAMNPPEKQDDESLRAMVTYETSRGLTDFDITAAFISDRMIYENEVASVNSRNFSKRFLLRSVLENSVNEILRVRFAFSNDFNIVNTNNYKTEKTRNVATADATAEAGWASWLTTRLLIRETLQDNKLLAPDFSAAAEIRPFSTKYYLIKASYSRNSKIPSLNEMFWSPGGNPDLKNETGYLSEVSMEMTSILKGSFSIKNDLTFFRNNLNNVIHWRPGEFSYWEADNVNNLLTSGLETSADFRYTVSGLTFRLNAGYTYTRATVGEPEPGNSSPAGKQLVYIPVNQLNALFKFSWRNFCSTMNTGFTGKRFLTADNSQYLPPYAVSDLNVGFRINAGNTFYEADFIIENLFDVSYQNIAWYPMPGRNYLLTLVFQLRN